MSVSISKLSVEAYTSTNGEVLGISHDSPRLSWRFEGSAKDWTQQSYVVSISGSQREAQSFSVTSSDSLFVPWPAEALKPRESVTLGVKVKGSDGQEIESPKLQVERALPPGNASWQAKVISSDYNIEDGGPFRVRKVFNLNAASLCAPARLYATAMGLYELEINGKKVGDQLFTPGWQAYKYRQHYQTYDVSSLLREGENEISSWVAEGWYGTLTWMRKRSYGLDIGVMAQLEIDGKVAVATDESWTWSLGQITSSGLYEGEAWDMTSTIEDWKRVRILASLPAGELVAPEAPPVRVTEIIQGVDLITTPSGKLIVDFGQNVTGWVRIGKLPSMQGTIALQTAEVLEREELGSRPLRSAINRDTIKFDRNSAGQTWEPKFTSHGFRYCLVENWPNIKASDLSAIVIHSDMEPTGNFSCSHPLISQLHKNVVWSMRDNFLSVPTDCPQRDERMGWTGDIQVFAPTASYLYDCNGMLQNWLSDLAEEQLKMHDGIPHLVVPDSLSAIGWKATPQAIWCDVCVLLPWDLYQSYGDKAVLHKQWDSMVAWLDRGVNRDPQTGLWHPDEAQLGDWLDPIAPPEFAGKARTNPTFVANIYLIHTTNIIAQIAKVIGKSADAERYSRQSADMFKAFEEEYITPNGRLMSDSVTAYSLMLKFGLIDGPRREKMAARLRKVVAEELFRVSTGFAGTPAVLPALAEGGSLSSAYRMLQEKSCPSWLYPVSKGATTVWERWDSMLEDGTINPGEMTSFNHYALGSAVHFLHKYTSGLSSLEPGWRKILVAPQPGGTLTHAETYHVSGYGRIACDWQIDGSNLKVQVEIPANCSAIVRLPGNSDGEIGSGSYNYSVPWKADESWPPKVIWPKLCNEFPEGPC